MRQSNNLKKVIGNIAKKIDREDNIEKKLISAKKIEFTMKISIIKNNNGIIRNIY